MREHAPTTSRVPPPEEIAKVLALARAVKEEAASGEHPPGYLVWQLAAAVEQLAQCLADLNRQTPD